MLCELIELCQCLGILLVRSVSLLPLGSFGVLEILVVWLVVELVLSGSCWLVLVGCIVV